MSAVDPQGECSVAKVCYSGVGGEAVGVVGPMLRGLYRWGKKCLDEDDGDDQGGWSVEIDL